MSFPWGMLEAQEGGTGTCSRGLGVKLALPIPPRLQGPGTPQGRGPHASWVEVTGLKAKDVGRGGK